MILKANEYPDIWEFREEQPTPEKFPTYINPKNKVSEFLNIFLTHRFFKKIIIWGNTRFNRTVYNMSKKEDFCIIELLSETEKLMPYIEYSCNDGGHMSVLFVPNNPQDFINTILSTKHYGEPMSVRIGSKDKNDPLCYKKGQNVEFFGNDILKNDKVIFCFTHDAQFLYEIFLNNERNKI